MLDLALNGGCESAITLNAVAGRQQISEKYLWQVVSHLKNAGLIKTVRGTHGGYTLAREPSTFTVKEILEALDGPCTLVPCVNNKNTCKRSGSCAARDIWQELGKKIGDTLAAVTLADMVDKQKQMQQNLVCNYTI